MLLRKLIAILSILVLIAGCSSSNKELPPAELVKFTPEVTLEVEWSRSIGDGQGDLYNRLVPAIDGDTIYVASADGIVFALDRFNGKVKWKQKLKLPISGGVSAGYGVVLLGTLKGEVIALDSYTGSIKWKAKVNSEILASPVTNGSVVVAQTNSDTLFGFDLNSGAQLWRYDNYPAILSLRGTATPVITNNLAIFALSNGHVIALDPERGFPVWEQVVAVPKGRSELERMVDIDGKLVISAGTLYVVSYQGQLVSMNLETGQINWQRQASSYTGVELGIGNVYISSAAGALESIDYYNAAQQWQNDQMARRQLSTPAIFDKYVAVGDFEGYLHLLRQADGNFAARRKIDGYGVRVQPLVVDNLMYVYGNGGKLVALSIK